MKKPLPLSVKILCLLYLILAGYLLWSASRLPDRVASHFNGAGRPDGWMDRNTHLGLMGAIGFVFPLLMSGLFYLTRKMPSWLVNIPNREYWLVPERREQAFDRLFDHSLWFACLLAGFSIGMHHLITQANLNPPPTLSGSQVLICMGLFVVGLVTWVIQLNRRFGIPKGS